MRFAKTAQGVISGSRMRAFRSACYHHARYKTTRCNLSCVAAQDRHVTYMSSTWRVMSSPIVRRPAMFAVDTQAFCAWCAGRPHDASRERCQLDKYWSMTAVVHSATKTPPTTPPPSPSFRVSDTRRARVRESDCRLASDIATGALV